jgi:ankyrin repeat protein
VSSIDNLKKEAKRRLKMLRAQNPSTTTALREVQHALAREHGHDSWTAMVSTLEHESQGRLSAPSDIVAAFLEFACWDHHVHGKGDHWRADLAAERLLAQHPEIARDSIYTAVVCGELAEVRRLIGADAACARNAGGARGWTPLLYLCFARFTHQPTIDNAVAIGRLLLDNGANPNDFYMAGSVQYSALVGAAGEGEQESPRQPWAQAMFDLLLERGAKPFDQQVLYNTHFSGEVLWWLELVWKHTTGTELAAAWRDPEWRMFDMGNYGTGAHFLQDLADKKRNQQLADWLSTHGANSSTAPKVAVNRQEDQPGPLHDMFTAARRDDVDAITRLLDAGVPIDIEDETKQTTLHTAAASNAVNVTRLLLERGAEVDPAETRFHATPFGFASYYHHTAILDLLSTRSRDLYDLCLEGYVDRVRVVLREEPTRATSQPSPLFWLPEDEDKALAIVEMLLAAGADAGRRNVSGRTPADVAERRGLSRLAARLRQAEAERPPAPSGELETLDSLAHDLVLAYDSGYEPGLQRLRTHFNRPALTWEEVRTQVRNLLSAIPEDLRPNQSMVDVYFALPHARLVIARASGFETWESLARYHRHDQ